MNKAIPKHLSLVENHRSNPSYVDFEYSMLPPNLPLSRMSKYFEFLSPYLLIIHGSTISGKKYSSKIESDLDIVCVTSKAAFWPLEQLYHRFSENIKSEVVKIDISIISLNTLSSIVIGSTSSLGASFINGFSIIQWKEKNGLP